MPEPKAAALRRPPDARDFVAGRASLTRVLFDRLRRNPAAGFAWLVAGGAGLAIFSNVLLFQPEQHRAPLFAGNPRIHAQPQAAFVPLPPSRPAGREAAAQRQAELAREIQAELTRRGLVGQDADAARLAKAMREAQAGAGLPVTGEPSEALLAALITAPITASAPARPKDQIAALLKAPADRLERPTTVAAVQRALAKLGYGPLKDDGQFGPGTRAALDRFERDRRLAARGENPTRVLRELAQASGVAID